jgi:hypothetical protein
MEDVSGTIAAMKAKSAKSPTRIQTAKFALAEPGGGLWSERR